MVVVTAVVIEQTFVAAVAVAVAGLFGFEVLVVLVLLTMTTMAVMVVMATVFGIPEIENQVKCYPFQYDYSHYTP